MTNEKELVSYMKRRNRTSLMLSGREGFPLYRDARRVCASLLDTTPEKLEAHPDFLLVRTEKNQLTVDDALSILEKADRLPSIAERTVVLIDAFDRFTPAAQNKLLKLLEEAETVTVVATSYGKKVLPTILSRMQTIEYHPLSFPAYKKAMEENGEAFDGAGYFATDGVPVPPDEGVLLYFKEAGKAVDAKDKKALFYALHLVREKDDESFFNRYRDRASSMLAFLGRKIGTVQALELSEEAGPQSKAQSYTKDDFFLAVARFAEML